MGTHREQISDNKLYNIAVQNIGLYGEEMVTNDPKLLITEKMRTIHENILYVLDIKKVYLDADLNLTKFSQILFTNTTYLSKVINVFFKCNLKTLLNGYRINYAKKLLQEEKCDIQSLPSRCGFVSRSTFYNAFTKFEHVTPSNFRSHAQSLKLRNEEI